MFILEYLVKLCIGLASVYKETWLLLNLISIFIVLKTINIMFNGYFKW